MGSAPSDRADLLLVCSSGGHLLQLVALRESWGSFTRAWVTFDKSDARSLLADERVIFAHGPTNRSIRNLLRNLLVAWRVVRDTRPTVMLTTGAGVAVPFAWVARLHGAQGRLRREPRADRGPFAQLPADRADRRAAATCSGRSSPRCFPGRGSPATSSRRTDDLRQRRDERGAVRPAAAGGRRALDRRGGRRPARPLARRRSRRVPSSSTSSRSRR